MSGTSPLRVSYFYDLSLPCDLAAPIQFLNTCHALARLGIPTTVFAGPVQAERCLAYYGLTPHEHLRIVPLFSRVPGRPELYWRVRRIVREKPASGCHVLLSRGEPGIALLPRLRRLGLPSSARLVYEAHRLCFAHEAERRSGRRWRIGDGESPRVERVRRREGEALRAADAIVCLTPAVQAAIAGVFGVERPALVLPSGVAPPADLSPGGESERDIDVIYAGKLEERKGIGLLLAAMRLLPDRRLVVLGGTPRQVDEHRRLAEQLGIADRVTLHGFVEPVRVPAYLRRARVGVCPLPTGRSVVSEEFTSPLKLLEMMAHGVPVVATDLPSVRAIAAPDRTALLIPPDDAPAMAAAIESLLSDPARADVLRTAAARRAAEFSWTERARRLLDFLITRVVPAPTAGRGE